MSCTRCPAPGSLPLAALHASALVSFVHTPIMYVYVYILRSTSHMTKSHARILSCRISKYKKCARPFPTFEGLGTRLLREKVHDTSRVEGHRPDWENPSAREARCYGLDSSNYCSFLGI